MRLGSRTLLVGPVALLLTWLLANSAVAQTGQCGVERKVTARALDELTWKQLNRVYEDVGEATNANTYYYLVRPLNACGQEGP